MDFMGIQLITMIIGAAIAFIIGDVWRYCLKLRKQKQCPHNKLKFIENTEIYNQKFNKTTCSEYECIECGKHIFNEVA